MKSFILIAFVFFCSSSLIWGQGETTDVKDNQVANKTIRLKNGGTLIIDGYHVRHVSNDPALGDSSNIDLVTEAAVVAYVQAYVAAYGGGATEVGVAPNTSAYGGLVSLAPDSVGLDINGLVNLDGALVPSDKFAWFDQSTNQNKNVTWGSMLTQVFAHTLTVDGASSGLDADLLDGQHGSHYLNPSNLSTAVPVGKGGTGLSALGAANQLLRVNAGVTGLEYFTPSFLTSEVDGSTSNELQNVSYTASTRAFAISLGTGFTFPLFTSTEAGLVPLSGGGTSNFLRADGTWAVPAGGTLTGTGAVNKVAFWTSTTNLSNNTAFHWDNTNARLGVGTTSPSALVHAEYSGTLPPRALQAVVTHTGTGTVSNFSSFMSNTVIGGSLAGISGDMSGSFYGLNIQTSNATFSPGRISALQADFRTDGSFTGTLIGTMNYCIDVTYNGTTAATVNDMKMVNVRVRTNAGSVGTIHGIYVESLAVGTTTNRYAFYQAGTTDKNVWLGNTGMGNTNATERLDITGNIILSGVIKNSDGTAALPSYAFTNDLDVGMWRPTSNTLAFSTAGVERWRIDANGRIGVGTTTTSIASNFEVFSTLGDAGIFQTSFGGSAVFPGIVGRNANGTAASPTATLNNDWLMFFSGRGHNGTAFNAASAAYIGIIAAQDFSSGVGGARMVFATAPLGSVTAVERMRLHPDGNLSIGNTTSTERLSVTGNLAFTGALMPNGAAGILGQYLASAGPGAPPTWQSFTGVTGTGTANRVAYWSGSSAVAGDADFTFDGTNVAVANPHYFSAGSASTPSLAPSGDSNNGWWFPAADNQAWSTGGTERMRLNSSGNLLIGNTTGTSNLTVAGSFHGFMEVFAPNGGGNAGLILGNDGDDNNTYMLYRADAGDVVLSQSDTYPFSSENEVLRGNKARLTVKTDVLNIDPVTATVASGVTASNGDVLYVNSTNGTFTSVGFWGRANGLWVKLGP